MAPFEIYPVPVKAVGVFNRAVEAYCKNLGATWYSSKASKTVELANVNLVALSTEVTVVEESAVPAFNRVILYTVSPSWISPKKKSASLSCSTESDVPPSLLPDTEVKSLVYPARPVISFFHLPAVAAVSVVSLL